MLSHTAHSLCHLYFRGFAIIERTSWSGPWWDCKGRYLLAAILSIFMRNNKKKKRKKRKPQFWFPTDRSAHNTTFIPDTSVQFHSSSPKALPTSAVSVTLNWKTQYPCSLQLDVDICAELEIKTIKHFLISLQAHKQSCHRLWEVQNCFKLQTSLLKVSWEYGFYWTVWVSTIKTGRLF